MPQDQVFEKQIASRSKVIERHTQQRPHRAPVYTGRLAGRVYVLHAFQKKSKTGIARKTEIDLIKQRLKRAFEIHAAWEKQDG